jgi:hypothetical protein
MSAYPASSILKALLQCGQMISCMATGPFLVGWTGICLSLPTHYLGLPYKIALGDAAVVANAGLSPACLTGALELFGYG